MSGPRALSLSLSVTSGRCPEIQCLRVPSSGPRGRGPLEYRTGKKMTFEVY